MTPAARLSTAIEILDAVLAGQPAGLTLTNWGRQNRYAGSRDRAAIRDIVFDCLRARRSLSDLGGAETGRAMVIAYASREGMDLDGLFTGQKYDPAPINDVERDALANETIPSDAVRLNYPDFLKKRKRYCLWTTSRPSLWTRFQQHFVSLKTIVGLASRKLTGTV